MNSHASLVNIFFQLGRFVGLLSSSIVVGLARGIKIFLLTNGSLLKSSSRLSKFRTLFILFDSKNDDCVDPGIVRTVVFSVCDIIKKLNSELGRFRSSKACKYPYLSLPRLQVDHQAEHNLS